MSVANVEEARRALNLARSYQDKGSYTAALKWARKSSNLAASPEAEALAAALEIQLKSGDSTPSGSASTSTGQDSKSTKATGAEAHPSAAGAHLRPGHRPVPNGDAESSKSRSYTPEQTKVVKRVIACKAHEYYSILAVEKSCTESEVRKAYRKLALALHPDKNGAPRADEAFKMVSKAFQVLSDGNLRAAYDSNPHQDPSSRGGGGGSGPTMSRGFGGGGHPGFGHATEVSPEDLFRAFFGGGGGFDQFGGGGGFGNPVFTFGGPNGFQRFGGAPQRRAAAGNRSEAQAPSWVQMIPLFILGIIALFSWLPAFLTTPNPGFQWKSMSPWTTHKQTSGINVDYYVQKREWENHPIFQSIPEEYRNQKQAGKYSNKLKKFESEIEQSYVSTLRQQCGNERESKRERVDMNRGIFGLGADWEKVKQIQAEPLPSCNKLKELSEKYYGSRSLYYN